MVVNWIRSHFCCNALQSSESLPAPTDALHKIDKKRPSKSGSSWLMNWFCCGGGVHETTAEEELRQQPPTSQLRHPGRLQPELATSLYASQRELVESPTSIESPTGGMRRENSSFDNHDSALSGTTKPQTKRSQDGIEGKPSGHRHKASVSLRNNTVPPAASRCNTRRATTDSSAPSPSDRGRSSVGRGSVRTVSTLQWQDDRVDQNRGAEDEESLATIPEAGVEKEMDIVRANAWKGTT